AKAFTRCGKEIEISVKSGGADPKSNPALRRVLQNARSVNMPKDKIEAAIKRALGGDSKDYKSSSMRDMHLTGSRFSSKQPPTTRPEPSPIFGSTLTRAVATLEQPVV